MGRDLRNTPETILLAIAAGTVERVEPSCPHFGACGGCQLQHLPYAGQMTAKHAMLVDVLRAAGVSQVPEVQLHSANPWTYRNRIRLRIEGDDIGYSRQESNSFLPIDVCPIASPLLERMALHMRDSVRMRGAAWPAGAASFELFTDADERTVQLAIHLRDAVGAVDREAPTQFRALCEQVRRDMPQLMGAGLLAAAPDAQQSRRVQATQRVEIARWGSPMLTYAVGDVEYTVTRNAFFQVNRYLTADMVRVVAGQRTGRLAFDLYAGSGLFSVPLSQRFAEVVAVEIGEPAATDLALHLALRGSPHRAVRSTAQAFLEHETRRPDLVVMDPPRAGVSLPALRALRRLQPAEIVYVSCDAGTFARDARTLLESGYTLIALHLFDLFPQTVHTETIAVFRI